MYDMFAKTNEPYFRGRLDAVLPDLPEDRLGVAGAVKLARAARQRRIRWAACVAVRETFLKLKLK